MKLNAEKIIEAIDKNVRAKYAGIGWPEERKLRSQQVIAAVEEIVKAINSSTRNQSRIKEKLKSSRAAVKRLAKYHAEHP